MFCVIQFITYDSQDIFNDTKITISGLSPVTTYRFQVFSANGVSDMTNEAGGFVDITVTTEASVMSASVNNVRTTSVKASEITLTWEPPFTPEVDMESPDHVEMYEVRLKYIWFVCIHIYIKNMLSLKSKYIFSLSVFYLATKKI